MAITLESQPGDWNLSRNGVGWVLSTDNEYSTVGVNSILDIDWNLGTYPVAGEQFTIAWNSTADSITFTFRLEPDDSGEEVELDTSSTGNFLTALKNSLVRNHKLSSAFNITTSQIGGNRLLLAAKQEGSEFTSQFSESTSASVTTSSTSGVDPVRRDNFKLLLNLKMWSTAAPSVIASEILEGTPVNGEVDFDVTHLLDSNIGENNVPNDDVNIQNHTSSIVQFSAVWAEKYGNPVLTRRLSEVTQYRALIGGWRKNRIATSDFDTEVDEGIFLSNLSDRRITQNQPEFLYYLSTGLLVSSHAELFYSDGSSEIVDLNVSPSAASNALWCIPFNYALIDAERDGAKELLYWDAFLSNQDSANPITNKVRYQLRDEFQIDSTILLFRNSFGVYEVIDFPGEVSFSTDVSRSDAQRVLPRDFDSKDQSTVTVAATYREKRTVSTGFISREEADWLQELCISDSIYELNESNHFPVRISVESFPRYSTQSDDLNVVSITIESDTNEKGY